MTANVSPSGLGLPAAAIVAFAVSVLLWDFCCRSPSVIRLPSRPPERPQVGLETVPVDALHPSISARVLLRSRYLYRCTTLWPRLLAVEPRFLTALR